MSVLEWLTHLMPPTRPPRDDDDARCVQTVNVYPDPAVAERVSELLAKVNQVLVNQDEQKVILMSLQSDLQEANAKLDEANVTTNEIAADIEALVAAAADAPANSTAAAEAKAKAHALADRLRAVADVHTTTPPAEPPAEA